MEKALVSGRVRRKYTHGGSQPIDPVAAEHLHLIMDKIQVQMETLRQAAREYGLTFRIIGTSKDTMDIVFRKKGK